MHNRPESSKKHYVRFQATEESLTRCARLDFGKRAAIFEALTEQWMLFYLMLFITAIGFPFYFHFKMKEPISMGICFAIVLLAIAIPLGIVRFNRTFRILREGVAVVGVVISDASPLDQPLIGKADHTKHKGLRITYVYQYNGKRHTGITGDLTAKRATGMLAPLRSVPDSTGVCKIILIDPNRPEIARSTPEDVFINEKARKRISEELDLICLA